MSEDTVTIEVDGRPLQARKGQMLIDVTDAAGIYIPRFCYHKKLSVAANCRMCLVEVERAPKPQPACATPVMDGMKVFTQSDKAVSGQKATMEFLLINHPLDCPICDQGGECELQDLAMGYGGDVSQYVERKRVVRDKDIGPLVQTDMTRCIHCTRCVRFGEEVAGLRELGATGRGEHMEIGTYVQQAMTSELSGNVIDLCPVGALTSKPYRFSARAWELQARPALAGHDCVGSNLHVHLKGQVVKRVVPRENEAVNETWISDRDRFSYQGLRHEERLLTPRVKRDGVWHECDWDTALKLARDALASNGEQLGALASPSTTSEEFLLLRRLVLGLGGSEVDYRLRHQDFRAENQPFGPGAVGTSLTDLARADAVLVVGGYPRHDQPLVHHRIRQAAQHGAKVFVVDVVREEYNFDLAGRLTITPDAYASTLAGMLAGAGGAQGGAVPTESQVAVATALQAAPRSVVVLANEVERSPIRTELEALARALAAATSSAFISLSDGANARGLARIGTAGSGVAGQLARRLSAYVLLGCEPSRDLAQPALALEALGAARQVIALTAFRSADLDAVASLQMPIALHAENEGSFVNLQGDLQTAAAAVKPPGDARPAWKILRVLGDQLGLDGFEAVDLAEVTREIAALTEQVTSVQAAPNVPAMVSLQPGALHLHLGVPMYSADPLVRRAPSLQQQPQVADESVRVAPATLASLGVTDGSRVRVVADGRQATGQVVADERVPGRVAWVQASSALAAQCAGVTGCVLEAVTGADAR